MSKPAKRHKRAATNPVIKAALTRTESRRTSDVLWPSMGPGRKRIITEGSLDELAATIAHRVAAAAVDEIRAGCERMAKDMIAQLLGERYKL